MPQGSECRGRAKVNSWPKTLLKLNKIHMITRPIDLLSSQNDNVRFGKRRDVLLRFRCNLPPVLKVVRIPVGSDFSVAGGFFRLGRLGVHNLDRLGSSQAFFLASACSLGCLTDLRDALLPLHLLLHFPLQAPNPAFGVAGSADQIVLKRDFLQAPVAGAPQSMSARQFAGGAFNGVVLLNLLLKSLRLHLPPPRLQWRVVLADDQSPVLLPGWNASGCCVESLVVEHLPRSAGSGDGGGRDREGALRR